MVSNVESETVDYVLKKNEWPRLIRWQSKSQKSVNQQRKTKGWKSKHLKNDVAIN